MRSRFADGLGGNHTNRLAHIHRRAACEIAAIAATADTVFGFAGQHRTDLHFLNTRRGQRLDVPLLDHGTGRYNHMPCGIGKIFCGEATENTRCEIGHDLTRIDNRAHHNAVG